MKERTHQTGHLHGSGDSGEYHFLTAADRLMTLNAVFEAARAGEKGIELAHLTAEWEGSPPGETEET